MGRRRQCLRLPGEIFRIGTQAGSRCNLKKQVRAWPFPIVHVNAFYFMVHLHQILCA